MANPYSTLGINESASDGEVKSAYRKLVTEYSSDKYQSEPNATIAANKLEELNAAYDDIMSRRRIGAPTGSSSSSSYATPNGVYADIRTLIRNGSISDAEQRLLFIPESDRGAEWSFLMGSVCREKGWLDDAYRYISEAVSLAPDNAEYKAVYNQLAGGRSSGSAYNPYTDTNRRAAAGRGGSGDCCSDDGCSNLCQCLCLYSMCQSCCCNGN